MSTALTVPNLQLPAHLQSAGAAALTNNDASAGIKAGGFPRISIAGSKFHVIKDGEKKLITSIEDPTLPMMRLEAVIVGWSPYASKTFYEGDFNENDSDKEPDCRSDNGIVPDADVVVKQSESCATCPKNAWGSKVSKNTGKDTKACSDGKRIVIVPAQALDSEAIALNITPAALKPWKLYVDSLTSKGVPLNSVVTGFTFDPTANFPRLQFAWMRFLSESDYTKVKERSDSEEVKSIANPRRVITVRQLPLATAPLAEGQTPAGQAAPAPVPAPAPSPAPAPAPKKDPEVDPRIVHLDPAMRGAVIAVGIDSVAGQAILKQFPAPVVEPPKPVDPYAAVPEAVKASIVAAVTAVGGPESAPGKAILSTFEPKGGETEATKPARGRTKKATAGDATQAPAAQPAPTGEAPAAKGFANPASTSVNQSAELEALLAKAMSTKV